jgi:Cft2 family RNA processing exonuclease
VRPLPKEFERGIAPRRPGLFVLSSGMVVERTPSYRAAAALLGHARNRIIFVGYCDPDTHGGVILATEPGEPIAFKALERNVPLKASVERLDLSGHANRDELCGYALARKPEAIVLTHGDPEARDWFRETLRQKAPEIAVHDPASREWITL